jgi:hypothetical protein
MNDDGREHIFLRYFCPDYLSDVFLGGFTRFGAITLFKANGIMVGNVTVQIWSCTILVIVQSRIYLKVSKKAGVT